MRCSPLNAAVLVLALPAPALAGDAVIAATSTVTVANPSASSPFSAVQVGDAITVHLEVTTPGFDIAPGQYTRYDLDLAASFVTIGSVTETFTSGNASLQNDFPVADGIRMGGGPLVGGGSLTLDVSESSGTLFSTTDILSEFGTWGPSTWSSFQFTITGGGSYIEFDLPTVTIDQPGSISTIYCDQPPNSTNSGGTFNAYGSVNIADNDVTLVASNLPPGQFGIFLTSTTTGMVNLGSAILCVGGSIGRFDEPSQILQADASGTYSLQIDLTQIPTPLLPTAIQPGETWHYQSWYRDQPSTGGFGFTQAMSITYQ